MTTKSYIGFGSNLGNRKVHLKNVLNRFSLHSDIIVQRISPLYETEPLTKDNSTQPWYLNCVIEILTPLTLHSLLSELQKIEQSLGRKNKNNWKPRSVDLDILFYSTAIYEDNELRVPHPGITKRNFVLKPLCDLIPNFIHPEYQMTLKELLTCCNDTLKVIPMDFQRPS